MSKRVLNKLAGEIRVCAKCPLCESRTNAVPGDGKATAEIMVIGEAPGRREDEKGIPFVGAAGKFLDKVLQGVKLDRQDLFITNIVKCRPPKNRPPKRMEVETCTSNYLFEQIKQIEPKLIMLLGGTAAKAVLGITKVGDARGKVINQDGRKYIVGYHPAYAFRKRELIPEVENDFKLFKREIGKL